MNIGAFVGVWNEVELIERCIMHLRKIGVDQILVCDMYSTDGTAEILESFISESLAVIKIGIQVPGEIFLDRCQEAVKRLDADWIMFVDADEFILPLTGNIRDCPLLMNADLISLRSYNVVCTSTGWLWPWSRRVRPHFPDDISPERYGDVDLIVRDAANFREQLSSDQPLPIVRLVWPPKVMARRVEVDKMVDGNHDIVPVNPNLRRANATDLLIAHLPITTRKRFMRKMQCIRETFVYHDKYFGSEGAWHWRYLLDLQDRGEIDREFERSVFSEKQLSELRSRDIVKTAADMLAPAARS
jgi:glycosyltransferase involved in cell wall biosynthesis